MQTPTEVDHMQKRIYQVRGRHIFPQWSDDNLSWDFYIRDNTPCDSPSSSFITHENCEPKGCLWEIYISYKLTKSWGRKSWEMTKCEVDVNCSKRKTVTVETVFSVLAHLRETAVDHGGN